MCQKNIEPKLGELFKCNSIVKYKWYMKYILYILHNTVFLGAAF